MRREFFSLFAVLAAIVSVPAGAFDIFANCKVDAV
jgi:hypothetical protein